MRGQLLLLEALLHDAATAVAVLERRIATRGDPTSVTLFGGAAVELLDQACRSIAVQRAALLERLAARGHVPGPPRGSPAVV